MADQSLHLIGVPLRFIQSSDFIVVPHWFGLIEPGLQDGAV